MIWPWKTYTVVIDVGMSEPHPKFYKYSGKQLRRLLHLGVVHRYGGIYEFARPYGPEVAGDVLAESDEKARAMLAGVKERWKEGLGKPHRAGR